MINYIPMNWEDRESENPNRRKITKISEEENLYNVERDEGKVNVEGTAWNKDTMDNFEGRIINAFNQANNDISKLSELRRNIFIPQMAFWQQPETNVGYCNDISGVIYKIGNLVYTDVSIQHANINGYPLGNDNEAYLGIKIPYYMPIDNRKLPCIVRECYLNNNTFDQFKIAFEANFQGKGFGFCTIFTAGGTTAFHFDESYTNKDIVISFSLIYLSTSDDLIVY